MDGKHFIYDDKSYNLDPSFYTSINEAFDKRINYENILGFPVHMYYDVMHFELYYTNTRIPYYAFDGYYFDSYPKIKILEIPREICGIPVVSIDKILEEYLKDIYVEKMIIWANDLSLCNIEDCY